MQFSRNWMSSRIYWFPAWNDKASLDIQRYGYCSAPVVVGHEWEFATLSRIKTNRGCSSVSFSFVRISLFHSEHEVSPSEQFSKSDIFLRILLSRLRVRWKQMSADLSSARVAMPVSTLIQIILQTICRTDWSEWTEWHQFEWPQ